MHKTFKTIFFKDRETAERFINLYDESHIHKFSYYDKDYYGIKSKDKICVVGRFSNEEINRMKSDIGLKERRWNGHKCYVYE